MGTVCCGSGCDICNTSTFDGDLSCGADDSNLWIGTLIGYKGGWSVCQKWNLEGSSTVGFFTDIVFKIHGPVWFIG